MSGKRRGEKLLRPVRPNVGIEVAYRRKLLALVDEMARSYAYWVKACYRRNEPVMAQDATPAIQLKTAVNRLGRYWNKRFNDAAQELAAYFAKDASRRSDAALKKILKDGGWSVKFRLTPAMRDIAAATVAENVALIKSISAQYHADVQGLVMRSVVAGRDIGSLTDDLYKRFDITRKRAALIARDQNAKMTGAFQRARQIEIGIKEAIWLHSHGGREPRRTHLANDGKRYNIATGWFDPDPKVRRHITPGELINCRCVSRAVVKGFS